MKRGRCGIMINLDAWKMPSEIRWQLRDRFRERRKEAGYSQEKIAEKSGVSLGSVKRFEQTGEISLTSFCKLLAAIGYLNDLDEVMKRPTYRSLDQMQKELERSKRRNE